MHDLTEARPTTEPVTAETIWDRGIDLGGHMERMAVLRLLNTHLILHDGEAADVIWTLAKIITAGHHRIHDQS